VIRNWGESLLYAMANLLYSYLKATSGSTRDAPPKPNAIPVIASDSPWKRRGGAHPDSILFTLHNKSSVGGASSWRHADPGFPKYRLSSVCRREGVLASYRYTLGDRSGSDHGRCSTEGILFESRYRQPPEQLPGPRGHFYDLGVIRSLDVMGSAGERSPGAPF
jgi:hypothetical protein